MRSVAFEYHSAMTNEELVFGYHERTKHHFHRYAQSPGYLDWATQPDPFRRFDGAAMIPLPLLDKDETSPYESLYVLENTPAAPVTLSNIGLLLECSLAISAWKEFRGERWALRCNPSSGNLHPTEGYILADAVKGLSDGPGVFHYAVKDHALERRARFDTAVWRALTAGFPKGTFIVGLTSIHWREAWKYGERAYRYCQQDAGHALATIRFAAAMLGWRATYLDGLGDEQVAVLLGLNRDADFAGAERENPDALIAVTPGNVQAPRTLDHEAISAIAGAHWCGQANTLSSDHVDWHVIEIVSQACTKPATDVCMNAVDPTPAKGVTVTPPCGKSAYRIIQQRRSAVAFDGKTGIDRDAFYRMLSRVVPKLTPVPWDLLYGTPAVHLGLFVHAVRGIAPGYYCLARDDAAVAALREEMKPAFAWARPDGRPEDLPLFLLQECDCRPVATAVSCGQEIAGDGAFSLGMIANLDRTIRQEGAWYYRRLFWECGMIAQVLYLEAEASGIRGTGMGCYFDDPVHEVFGITRRRYQSLYHFTCGRSVEDGRLTTLPPYPPARRSIVRSATECAP